jgi:membrane dipeptidase
MRHPFPPGLGYDQDVQFVAPEQLEGIVQILLSWGYQSNDLKALLGGNLLRLARAVWQTPHNARVVDSFESHFPTKSYR